MMPRPAATGAPRPAAPADADPWRERIAALEVQLSATRNAATRATADVTSLRDRVEAALGRLEGVETSAREAVSRADRPLPLEDLRARLGELETLAQSARAASAALRGELAENRRLDEARQHRIESLEDRVQAATRDPRPDQLRLDIDRLEVRLLAAEREQASLRDRLAERAPAPDPAEQTSLRERLEAAERAQGTLAERLEAAERAQVSRERLVAAEARAAAAEQKAAAAAALAEQLEARLAELERRADRPAAPRSPKGGFDGIAGIGPKIATKLRAQGVGDAAALAALSDDDRARLATEIGVKREKLDAWCAAAGA